MLIVRILVALFFIAVAGIAAYGFAMSLADRQKGAAVFFAAITVLLGSLAGLAFVVPMP